MAARTRTLRLTSRATQYRKTTVWQLECCCRVPQPMAGLNLAVDTTVQRAISIGQTNHTLTSLPACWSGSSKKRIGFFVLGLVVITTALIQNQTSNTLLYSRLKPGWTVLHVHYLLVCRCLLTCLPSYLCNSSNLCKQVA